MNLVFVTGVQVSATLDRLVVALVLLVQTVYSTRRKQ